MDATIIIGTFGSDVWKSSGISLCQRMYKRFNVPVIFTHGKTLASARNTAAKSASTEWLCFLDADDELDFNYFDEMYKATGDLRVPRLFEVDEHCNSQEVILTDRNMEFINVCPIGTLIRKDMFLDIGGFWEEPFWEDYSLFRRAWLIGATIEHTQAEYIAKVRSNSRNRTIIDGQIVLSNIFNSHEAWLESRRK